eukprot:3645378-Lingulodinium_polyedra.AAC.1
MGHGRAGQPPATSRWPPPAGRRPGRERPPRSGPAPPWCIAPAPTCPHIGAPRPARPTLHQG